MNNISNSLQLRNAIKSEYHSIKQESSTELFIVNKWNQFWQSVKDLLGVQSEISNVMLALYEQLGSIDPNNNNPQTITVYLPKTDQKLNFTIRKNPDTGVCKLTFTQNPSIELTFKSINNIQRKLTEYLPKSQQIEAITTLVKGNKTDFTQLLQLMQKYGFPLHKIQVLNGNLIIHSPKNEFNDFVKKLSDTDLIALVKLLKTSYLQIKVKNYYQNNIMNINIMQANKGLVKNEFTRFKSPIKLQFPTPNTETGYNKISNEFSEDDVQDIKLSNSNLQYLFPQTTRTDAITYALSGDNINNADETTHTRIANKITMGQGIIFGSQEQIPKETALIDISGKENGDFIWTNTTSHSNHKFHGKIIKQSETEIAYKINQAIAPALNDVIINITNRNSRADILKAVAKEGMSKEDLDMQMNTL